MAFSRRLTVGPGARITKLKGIKSETTINKESEENTGRLLILRRIFFGNFKRLITYPYDDYRF
jgi:hypothetical protein